MAQTIHLAYNKMKQVIPGIRKLYMTPCSQLDEFNAERYGIGEPVYILSELTGISFVGEPTLESEGEYKNNGRLYKVTLKFKSSDSLDDSLPYAFIVVDMYGKAHVVGTREKPFPILKSSTLTGTSSKAAVTEYEISYSSSHNIYQAIL